MAVSAENSDEVVALPLFADVGRKETARLLHACDIRHFPPGTIIVREGEPPNELPVILSGTVETYCDANGREWGAMLMNAGDVISPGASLFNEPHALSARTLGPCRILLIDSAQIRAEARTCAPLALHLARAMAGQFRVATRQVVDLKSRNAAQRLGSFLLRFADSSGAPTPELPMRKRNLAARIGMTPETLSRTLQILADNGLVVRGRQIIVRDRERIEHFCGPEPHRPPVADTLQVHVL